MERTLEAIIADAALHGYDFELLMAQIGPSNKEFKEYFYGYMLSEDKASYIEAILKEEVEKCDRIYIFEDELQDYLSKIKTIPHTKIISGFHILEDLEADDGSTYDASIFRIILIDDTSKKALIKDIEYIDAGSSEKLSIWGANLDYKEAIQTISDYGSDELIETAENMIDIFMVEEDIKLNEHLIGIFLVE